MIERHKRILDVLSVRNNVSVSELSDLLNVSEVTVRSDLNSLANDGKIVRYHGSAQLIDERVRVENSFQIRRNHNYEKKLAIGIEAVKLLSSNDSFLVDSSSTVLAMITALKNRSDLKEITAIPTGIWAALELMGIENSNILIPGGYLRHKSGSITGLSLFENMSGLRIQKSFLGAWGISIERGFSDSHLLEIELKKNIMKYSEEVIILADSSKFKQSGIASYSRIDQITTLITDNEAPENILKEIESYGVNVIVIKNM